MIVGVGVAACSLARNRGIPVRATNYRLMFMLGVLMLVLCAVFYVAAAFVDAPWSIGMPLTIIDIVDVGVGWSHRTEWSRN